MRRRRKKSKKFLIYAAWQWTATARHVITISTQQNRKGNWGGSNILINYSPFFFYILLYFKFVLFHRVVFVRCSIALACPLLLLAVRESWIDWVSVNIGQEQICTTVAWESDEQLRGELWKNLCILKYIHWVRPNTLFSLIFFCFYM